MDQKNDVNQDDPCDVVTSETLSGWIKRDSSRMCPQDHGEGLGRDSGDRYSDSWIRFDNG